MAANSKHHITISSSLGTYGFITKQYSSRQKPDSLFGSRFSTGEISYSTMNRWQRYVTTSWLGGAFQKYFESDVKFRYSNNIDVMTHGTIKLAKKPGDVLYDGASAIKAGVYFNGAHYFAEGQYIKYTTDNFATAPSVSKDFGADTVVSDMEIHDGKLWAAVGADGVWSHDTSDHTTWAELLDGVATIGANYLRSWGDNLYITYTNLLKYYDGSTITTVKNFSSGGDSVYYLKKPIVYASKLYFQVNVSGSSNGRGDVWYYDGTNMDIIYTGDDPIGENMVVYDSLLIFVVYGLEKVIFKKYNGSVTDNLQILDIAAGSTLYGTGLKYGTGVLYGAGSDQYSDPISFAIWKNNLVCIVSRTTSQNTILLYDTVGFIEYIALPDGSNYSAKMWLYNRDLFIGSSNGNIRQIGSLYAADGFLQSSIWDAGLQDINKLFADIMVKHEALVDGDSIDVWYRTDNDSGFALLGSNSVAGTKKFVVNFPTGADTVLATQLEYKIILNSSDGTTSPVVEDVIVRYILAPDNSNRVFEYTIEALKKIKLLDGTFETYTPEQIINNLWALKNSNELLTLVDENGDSHSVVFSDTSPESITPFSGDDVTEKYVYIRLFEI